MDRTYSDYVGIIHEVEKVEQVVRTDNKIEMWLLFMRVSINVNINISKIQMYILI